jgi:hypothetical protein
MHTKIVRKLLEQVLSLHVGRLFTRLARLIRYHLISAEEILKTVLKGDLV